MSCYCYLRTQVLVLPIQIQLRHLVPRGVSQSADGLHGLPVNHTMHWQYQWLAVSASKCQTLGHVLNAISNSGCAAETGPYRLRIVREATVRCGAALCCARSTPPLTALLAAHCSLLLVLVLLRSQSLSIDLRTLP
jgi:hypothetical protein